MTMMPYLPNIVLKKHGKFASKSSIFIALQEGDLLVCRRLDRVTICLSITLW